MVHFQSRKWFQATFFINIYWNLRLRYYLIDINIFLWMFLSFICMFEIERITTYVIKCAISKYLQWEIILYLPISKQIFVLKLNCSNHLVFIKDYIDYLNYIKSFIFRHIITFNSSSNIFKCDVIFWNSFFPLHSSPQYGSLMDVSEVRNNEYVRRSLKSAY